MAHTCRESCGVCGFLSPSNEVEIKNILLSIQVNILILDLGGTSSRRTLILRS